MTILMNNLITSTYIWCTIKNLGKILYIPDYNVIFFKDTINDATNNGCFSAGRGNQG